MALAEEDRWLIRRFDALFPVCSHLRACQDGLRLLEKGDERNGATWFMIGQGNLFLDRLEADLGKERHFADASEEKKTQILMQQGGCFYGADRVLSVGRDEAVGRAARARRALGEILTRGEVSGDTIRVAYNELYPLGWGYVKELYDVMSQRKVDFFR